MDEAASDLVDANWEKVAMARRVNREDLDDGSGTWKKSEEMSIHWGFGEKKKD